MCSCTRCFGIFQSTLPRGERPRFRLLPTYFLHFNPRSREGSDVTSCPDAIFIPNFNPRSREGSDVKKVIQEAMETISIHAPARGATILTHVRPDRIFYFNPRSREGSDWMADSYKHKPKDFNPRSREGSDRIRTALIIWISYFNPRSREGSDVELSTEAGDLWAFQSTLPRGERQARSPRHSFDT